MTLGEVYGYDMSSDTYFGDLKVGRDKGKDITSLEGCPKKVKGKFTLRSADISSLEGSPEIVEGNFVISQCKKLKTLEGSPKQVDGDYTVINCGLTSLKGIGKFTGSLWIENNSFTSQQQIIDELVKYKVEMNEGTEVESDFGKFNFNLKEEIKQRKMGKFKDFLDL